MADKTVDDLAHVGTLLTSDKFYVARSPYATGNDAHAVPADFTAFFTATSSTPARVAAGDAALRALSGEEGLAIVGTTKSGAVKDDAGSLSAVGSPSEVMTTATRSTAATFVGRDMLLQTAAINALRYAYDPVTYKPRGIQFDPAATNLFLQSNNFGSASWLKTRLTVTDNSTSAPDGTTTGDALVVDGTATTTHYIRQTFTATANTAYTTSFYISKTATYSPQIQLYAGFQATSVNGAFNPATGVCAVVSGTATVLMEDASNNMWRCSMTATSQAVPASAAVAFHMTNAYTPSLADMTFSGDSVFSIPISCAQFEVGSAPSAYIDTTTASVARTGDTLAIATSSIPGFNINRCTVIVEFSMQNLRGDQRCVSIDDNTSGDCIEILSSSGAGSDLLLQTYSGDAFISSSAIGSGLARGTVYRLAFSVSNGSVRSSLNGAAVVTTAIATMPASITHVRFGQRAGGTAHLDGYIREARVISRLFSNADLIAHSTL